MESNSSFRVSPELLRRSCDPSSFPFDCTDQLHQLEGFIGQDRAIGAVHFALEVGKPGYNLFVTGLTGTGRASAIEAHVQALIEEHKTEGLQFIVNDWCYVFNFTDPDQPQILKLPQGQGREFRHRTAELLRTLREEILKLFSTEEYQAQRKKTEEEGRGLHQQTLESLHRRASAENFGFQFSQTGVNLFVLKEGKALSQSEFMQLIEDERRSLELTREKLTAEIQSTLERLGAIEQETINRLRALDRSVAETGLAYIFKELLDHYQGQKDTLDFLQALKEYTLDNLNLFREQEGPPWPCPRTTQHPRDATQPLPPL